MADKLIYLVYPILLVLLLFGVKGYRKWNPECMSLRQTKAIQGFCAIGIMLHHIAQNTCAFWLAPSIIVPGLEIFVDMGYLFVAVFLFYSGYGLYKSKQTKPNYLQGFFRKRILPLMAGFYITAWVFLIVRLAMGESMSFPRMLYYVFGLQLCNTYSWFPIALTIFYLAFYFSFKYIKSERLAVTVTCLSVLVYMFIGTCCDRNDWWFRGQWWYNCVHLFPLGLLFARHEEKVLGFFKKIYWVALPATVLFYHGFLRLRYLLNGSFTYTGEDFRMPFWGKVGNRWVCLLPEMLLTITFVLFLLLLSMKLRFGNKALAFMGTITFEFYIVHGLFVELFGHAFLDFTPSIIYIRNVALYLVVILACTFPSALLLKKVIGLLTTKKEK